MKIALIYPPSPMLLDDHIDPPFGLIIIGTMLQKAGHDVEIVDLSHPNGATIPEDADVCGMSLFSANYDVCVDILRNLNGKPVIAGGPHATALPQDVLGDGFAAVVLGECEGDVVEIFERVVSGERGVFRGQPVQNLDGLPYWDYGLVDMPSFGRIVDGRKAFNYMPSRGCPYRCHFCWTAYNEIKVRFHSVDRIITEMKRNSARYVRFFDDNFGMHKRHTYALCNALAEEGIKYRCTPRVGDLSKKMCEVLANTGCLMVNFGVESGSDAMLEKMNKKQTTKQIKEGIENAKRVGMLVRIGLVIGFPGETWETIEEGVKFLKTCPFDDFNPYLFVPFPGCLPYHEPERFGITWLSNNWADYHILSGDCKPHVAFETDELNRETLLDMRSYVKEELSARADLSMVNLKYASIKNARSSDHR